jgi:hypothetical protein
MRKRRVGTFAIDNIECFDWRLGFGSASVRASNLEGDSIEFVIYRHPNDFTVLNIEGVDIHSVQIQPYEVQEIVAGEIQELVEAEIHLWWDEVQRVRDLLQYRTFAVSAGVTPPDSFYALVAYLYQIRQVYSYRKIVECMAIDMNIKVDACRERVRRSRNRGFLTSPGRGKVGRGRVTKRAITLLEGEGILKVKSPTRKKGWI